MEKLNYTKEEIINKIGRLRTSKNITAYKLSKELGHSKTYFYRVENGAIQLSLENFLDVLDILGVTTSEFFCPFLTNEVLEIISIFNKLSEKDRTTVKEILYKFK